ncbi:alpha/beta fold hydrolase [Fodinicola acaciae]|uniref:alpha/beta fold hydrolase n=1 Tax=Fodinicola acaciae TaxID=2681555 RepID=UPI0013D252AB|nr:alpha/beta hydrolase [Fodinicola acaciae]
MHRADVVLVHGGFLGPWIWEDVAGILRNAGVRAHLVDLPSVGQLKGFEDDVRAVREAVEQAGAPVVCGHSYAGAVITEAVREAKHLVYLTAVVPDVGESLVNLSDDGAAEEPVTVNADGSMTLDPAGAVAMLFHDCARVRAWDAVHRLRPANAATGHHAVTRAAWRELPCTYVRGLYDRLDEVVAPDFWLTADVREIPTGHCPQWSRPDLVANVLLDLA